LFVGLSTEKETAVNLDPNGAEKRYALGQSYLAAGESGNACKQFAQGSAFPDECGGILQAGSVCSFEGDLKDTP
jgi:hypothetical protein